MPPFVPFVPSHPSHPFNITHPYTGTPCPKMPDVVVKHAHSSSTHPDQLLSFLGIHPTTDPSSSSFLIKTSEFPTYAASKPVPPFLITQRFKIQRGSSPSTSPYVPSKSKSKTEIYRRQARKTRTYYTSKNSTCIQGRKYPLIKEEVFGLTFSPLNSCPLRKHHISAQVKAGEAFSGTGSGEREKAIIARYTNPGDWGIPERG